MRTTENVRELSDCGQLSVLDLSDNELEEEEIYDVLAAMPELHVLCLTNNNIVRETRDYRRWLIYRCAKLTYLDGRPIHVRDRACIQAWKEVSPNSPPSPISITLYLGRPRCRESCQGGDGGGGAEEDAGKYPRIVQKTR